MEVNHIVSRVMEAIREDKDLVPIELSGRHVHLSKKHVEDLFGPGYELAVKKELSQPGQYLCSERLRLIGPKGVLDNVAVLGPCRDKTQVEVSKTDSAVLGLKPPVRESGDIEGSSPLYLAYRDRMVRMDEGLIIAKRHIHMNPEDSERLGVSNGQMVNVRVMTERPLVFEQVLVRVSDRFRLNMHIDYDEGNACLCQKGTMCKIVK